MDPSVRGIEPEELLAQMGWVTALARSLVRDPNVAQDVAQQTWLTALERPPHTARSGPGLRAWLATVTRTMARQSVRGEGRRTAREKHAAQHEAEPSTFDVVERGERQRMLVDQVLELEEPYRSTVLYRYLDGLSAPEIAERVGVTPAAVRKRLSRGLEQLRGRLDAAHGDDRRTWMAALLPLARLPGRTTAASGAGVGAGALAVGSKVLVAASVAAVIWAVVAVWSDDGGALPADGALIPGQAVPIAGAELPRAPVSLGGPQQLPVAGSGALAIGTDGAPDDGWTWPPFSGQLHGQVVDLDGQPVPDVRMRFEPVAQQDERDVGNATITSFAGPDGRFVLEGIRKRGRVFVASSSLVTVYPGNTDYSGAGGGQVVVVSPRQRLGGQVVDVAGSPLEHARVSVRLPEGFEARFGQSFEFASHFDCSTSSTADGRFDLVQAPRITEARIEVALAGYELHEQPMPDPESGPLLVQLQRPANRLTGLVVDEAGRPVDGARVSCGPLITRSDLDGAFAFYFTDAELARVPPTDGRLAVTLLAARTGVVPASREVTLPTGVSPVALDGIVLELGGPALTLRGRVVDPRGFPLKGVSVWVTNPTVFAPNPYYLRGPEVPAGETQSFQTSQRSGLPDPLLVLESVVAGTPDTMWAMSTTDTEGRFELKGLADREYVVAAMNRSTLLRTDSPSVQAGSDDLTITLDSRAVYTRVTGRVVTRRGEPLEGVSVSMRGAGLELTGNVSSHTRRGVFTAPDGSFSLAEVPREKVHLWIEGTGVLGVPHALEAAGGMAGALEGLEIVVPVRLQLLMELDDPGEADRLRVVDARGEPVLLNTFQYGRRRQRSSVAVVDGRSEIVSVTDDAAAAVLLRDGEEVRRIPLVLLRGELNQVR